MARRLSSLERSEGLAQFGIALMAQLIQCTKASVGLSFTLYQTMALSFRSQKKCQWTQQSQPSSIVRSSLKMRSTFSLRAPTQKKK